MGHTSHHTERRNPATTTHRRRTVPRMALAAIALALAAWTAACGGRPGADAGNDQADGQTAGQQQTTADSAAKPQRPGMLRAVDRARATSDSMAARAARMDSMR